MRVPHVVEVLAVVWGGFCIKIECLGVISGLGVGAPHVVGVEVASRLG